MHSDSASFAIRGRQRGGLKILAGLTLIAMGGTLALTLPALWDRGHQVAVRLIVVERLAVVSQHIRNTALAMPDSAWIDRSQIQDQGRPLITLDELATRIGSAVVLTNGKWILARAGSDDGVRRLASLMGQEAVGEKRLIAPDRDWGAVGVPLATDLWLWALADARGFARIQAGVRARHHTTAWVLGGVAALLGVLVCGRGFRMRMHARFELDPDDMRPATVLDRLPGVRLAERPTPAAFTERSGGEPVKVESSGLTLGRYTLVSRLGEGGMAEIYNAVCYGAAGFRRRFVVKRLRPELASSPDAVEQFVDEARLAATLVQSNILTVLDFGQAGGEYYMATEHILGRDLRQITSRLMDVRGRALDVEIILWCMGELLKALAFVHDKTDDGGVPLQLVHRDVSPNNVLVSAGGEVKLLDFGIVKARDRRFSTRQGTVKGNPLFMSPEQARGTAMDHRSDLFSLGLLAYYLAVGETLYQGNTDYEILTRAANGPGESDLACIETLPAPLNTVLPRVLAPHPDQRFQDAGQFRDALQPFLIDAGPMLAKLLTSLYRDEFTIDEQTFSAMVRALETGNAAVALGAHLRRSRGMSGPMRTGDVS